MAGGALAEKETGTRTLQSLDHVDIEMDNSEAYSMRVTIDVRVIDGVNVNVYFMDDEGYAQYLASSGFDFEYFEDHSKKDTKRYEEQFVTNEEGVFHVVIDNSLYSSFEMSTVKYDVEWEKAGGLSGPWCLPLIIIILAILIVLVYTLRGRGPRTGTGSTPEDIEGFLDRAQVYEPILPEGKTPDGVDAPHDAPPSDEMSIQQTEPGQDPRED
jgi:hypothetical protein